MILKVNYSDPLYVSSSILKDVINLVFLDNKIFQAKSDGYRLEANFSILAIEVPSQMASEEDFIEISGLGSGAESGMIFTLVVPLAFMVFMSVSMNRVWALYNMLQLLINLDKYVMVSVPSNMQLILEIITNIVNFSILEQEDVKQGLEKHVFGRAKGL